MRILVAAGASGGHIFPALSFIRALKDKEKGIDALLVIPKRSAQYNLALAGVRVKYVSFLPVQLRLGKENFPALWGFLKGSLQSLYALLEFRPDIVVGFGALDTVPLLLFAWMARAKTLIHEQNVIPGMANSLLARFSDRIAVSFEETKGYLKDYARKVVLTGNPLRKELIRIEKNAAKEFFGLDKVKLTLLVMGGSQGSSSINAAFLKSVSLLTDKSGIQVIHISGKKDYGLIRDQYKDLNINAKVFGFSNDMQFAYSASDLVVSRAGATAVSEIIFYKLPAILIPYPYAYSHQSSNAGILRRQGCAAVIEDKQLCGTSLKETIESLTNREKLERMRRAYDSLKSPEAGALLANEALSLNLN